jgi:hypothetical protein
MVEAQQVAGDTPRLHVGLREHVHNLVPTRVVALVASWMAIFLPVWCFTL